MNIKIFFSWPLLKLLKFRDNPPPRVNRPKFIFKKIENEKLCLNGSKMLGFQ